MESHERVIAQLAGEYEAAAAEAALLVEQLRAEKVGMCRCWVSSSCMHLRVLC